MLYNNVNRWHTISNKVENQFEQHRIYHKCKAGIYFNPQSFWNINDVGVKCDRWNTTNTITIDTGELRKQV
jgi:hypothetical protein